jgi:hypothetical protein
MKFVTLSFVGVLAAAGMMALAPAPAAAQGTLNPMPKPTNGSCPSGWTDYASQASKPGDLSSGKGNTCYPTNTAKPAYRPNPSSKPCDDGYVRSGSFCTVGEKKFIKASAASVKKAHPLDRCPVGFFTLNGNGELCTSMAANPPSIRLKGEGPCNEGEIEDWGLWCVSNYEQLTRKDAAKGFPDYNAIYQTSYKTTGKTSKPNQADLPEGKEYTPAYFTIFGRVDREGNPIGGGAGTASAAATGANPQQAAGEVTADQCKPKKKKKKKGFGALGKALGNAVGVEIPDDGC